MSCSDCLRLTVILRQVRRARSGGRACDEEAGEAPDLATCGRCSQAGSPPGEDTASHGRRSEIPFARKELCP
ncbi:hypothetical protein C8D87_112212 [Lentzea atacamensis]|uniref:Uncharacterized protein n=1 Tax=Lentzea atacamensis TaxID=531938 RepID=A0ABX9DXP2_9PSEU|nr:hypothetical protein C8D87_112212 [Lentzea atacamensis]